MLSPEAAIRPRHQLGRAHGRLQGSQSFGFHVVRVGPRLCSVFLALGRPWCGCILRNCHHRWRIPFGSQPGPPATRFNNTSDFLPGTAGTGCLDAAAQFALHRLRDETLKEELTSISCAMRLATHCVAHFLWELSSKTPLQVV